MGNHQINSDFPLSPLTNRDLDSANSGSMQSSSSGGGGDDQEHDSRNGGDESISAWLNPMTSTFNNLSPPLQLYYNSFSTNNGSSSSFDAGHHHHHQLSSYLDPRPTLSQSSSFHSPHFEFNHNPNNHNPIHNHSNHNQQQLDMVWPNQFRPSISTDVDDANYTMPIPSHHQQTSPPPPPPPPPPPLPSPASTSAPTRIPSGSGRNPKKRSRASRRAPTTVLTTDRNNFRQMVQEFTGVPAPPFTAYAPRARFDLFNGLGLGLGSGLDNGTRTASSSHHTPPYLLRPFPHKIPPLHQPPFLANISSNSSASATVANNNTTAAMSNTTSAASTTFNQLCDQQLIDNTNPLLTSLLAQQTSSAAATAVVVNVASNGEGTVDSWICSSSE